MSKKIVIAGFGDTGVLVAINLPKSYDITGVSAKPCLVSGQELGARITRPKRWRENYLMSFARYRQLEGVNTVHGSVTSIDTQQQQVQVRCANGIEETLPYDVLVVSLGVRNGFWRNNRLESMEAISEGLESNAKELAEANSIAIIGGGPSGVSAASNLKERYPQKAVHLFFSGEKPLPGYHPKTRDLIVEKLERQSVELHQGHRANTEEAPEHDSITTAPIQWHTGQAPFTADKVLWAIGSTTPNSDTLPAELLDDQGYVKSTATLQVPGFDNIFTVGDIAATDPNRSSARNAGYLTVAHNIQCLLDGKISKMKRFKPSQYRWGAITGVQENGMEVFSPGGSKTRFSPWVVNKVLFPWIVRKLMYKGITDSP